MLAHTLHVSQSASCVFSKPFNSTASLATCARWCAAYPSYCCVQVGHQLVAAYAACTGLPLYRRRIHGASTSQVRTSSGSSSSSSSSGARGSNHVPVQYTVCHDTGCYGYAFSRVTCYRIVAWVCDVAGGCLQTASASPMDKALHTSVRSPASNIVAAAGDHGVL
jgi:hypothetical protein